MIVAVLFDLDDTLYDQQRWLECAWKAVSEAAAPYGVDSTAFRRELVDVASGGSDRGHIIDRALARLQATDVAPLPPLLEAFRSAVPARLSLYPGARQALRTLRAEVPIGLVTDGDVGIQRAKLRLLELDDAFDVVVLSDELGRARRKPHPAPFQAALTALGAQPEDVVHIGDRPDKDVRGAAGAGMRAIRVRTGEYAAVPDEPAPWRSAREVCEAVSVVLESGLTPVLRTGLRDRASG